LAGSTIYRSPSETSLLRFHGWFAAGLDVDIEQVAFDHPTSNAVVDVAAIVMDRVDIDQQAVGVDRVQGGFEEFDVVAVRAVERPADRDAVSVDADRPLVTSLPRSTGLGPVPSRPCGALCWQPSIASIDQVERPILAPLERRRTRPGSGIPITADRPVTLFMSLNVVFGDVGSGSPV
jgi:hypothetical protein